MRFSFLVAALVLGTGCTSIQSNNIKTAGMSAIMRVVADGTGQSTVNASLRVDNNETDFVDLSSGDSLVATVLGHSQTLSRSSFFGAVSYQTTFTGADGEGTLFTVTFNRTDDVSAPSSTATLPKPFNITAPAPSGTFSRSSSDITVTYDNSGTADPMTWTADGSCLGGQKTGAVPGDRGSFAIPKGTFAQTEQTCPATITLKRAHPGQLDTHFGFGGSIDAAQARTLSFSSIP